MFHLSNHPSAIKSVVIQNIQINLPEGIEEYIVRGKINFWRKNINRDLISEKLQYAKSFFITETNNPNFYDKITHGLTKEEYSLLYEALSKIKTEKIVKFQNLLLADEFIDKIIHNLRSESKNKGKPVIYAEVNAILIGGDTVFVEIPLNEEDQVMRVYDRNFGKFLDTHYVTRVVTDEVIRKLAKYTLYGGMAFSKETSMELIGQQVPRDILRKCLSQGFFDDIIGDLSHKYVNKNYYEYGRSLGEFYHAIGHDMSPQINPTFDFELYYKIFSRYYDLASGSFEMAPIGPGNSFINDNFARQVEPGNRKNILQYFVQSLTKNEIIFADNTCINIGDRIERRMERNPMMKGIPYPMKREGLLITPRQGVLYKINTIEKTVVMADISDPDDKSMHCEFEIYDIIKLINSEYIQH